MEFTTAIELNPKYAAAYVNRGDIYNTNGAVDLAIADYTQAIGLNHTDARTYLNLGFAFIKKGEADLAITNCAKAIELEPDESRAYFIRGNAYFSKGEIKQAIADYAKAIKLKPDGQAYYARALAWAHLHEWEKAEADLAAARERSVELPEDIAAMLTGQREEESRTQSAEENLIQHGKFNREMLQLSKDLLQTQSGTNLQQLAA